MSSEIDADARAYCQRAIAYLKPCVNGDAAIHLALDHAEAPVFRELGNGLLVAYLVDEDSHFSYVQRGVVTAAGMSDDELHGLALDNLREAVEVHVHAAGAVHTLVAGGNFEASLLLLDELWEHALRGFVTSAYVVAIPARDVLAFADASSDAGHQELRDIVRRVWTGDDHLLSDQLFTRVGGTWIPIEHAATVS